VSGIVALLMEANPQLTPDEVVTLLRQTATTMPYEERVVGAGYVDAHNAVRAAMSLAMVAHPADLFPSTDPNAPQIVDPANDQVGTTAQDIREAYFKYDPVADQIVYRLRVSDASVQTPNMRWTLTSTFGQTQVFVTASVDETATTYEYGHITTLATGTQNQETLGTADFGEIAGNEITIKLARSKVTAAVGAEILDTTSTNTLAQAQILIGSSLSGGLLLSSDQGTGSSFNISRGTQPSPTPTVTPSPSVSPSPEPSVTPQPSPTPNAGGRFDERYSGTVTPGGTPVIMGFEVRRSTLDAQMNQNNGNQQLTFDLLDSAGNVVATASDRRVNLDGLAAGTYAFRVRGNVTKPVDFTIKCGQGR
jgi:hypothetical protein